MGKKIVHIISRELSLLVKHPRLFWIRWVQCFLLNGILGIKRDMYFTSHTGIKIKFPNRIGVSYVLMETFVYKLFADMKGLDRVVDIGGFIGESALYLAKYNKEVYCYELSPKNFSYLATNCGSTKNIHCYNAAVTTLADEYIAYAEDEEVESTTKIASSSTKNMLQVKNINSIDLLQKTAFDGLKLDIEGGEYEMIPALIDLGVFRFERGIIEFHDLHLPEHLASLKRFIAYLEENRYTYKLFTNENKKLDITQVPAVRYCNVFFCVGR